MVGHRLREPHGGVRIDEHDADRRQTLEAFPIGLVEGGLQGRGGLAVVGPLEGHHHRLVLEQLELAEVVFVQVVAEVDEVLAFR